jgi:16S rRNA processing protein RimM
MINPDEISPIGYVNKPHGIKGEVSITFEKTNFDEDEISHLIFDMDGIYVPFFIENFHFKSDSNALYKFESIDTEEQAKEFTGKSIFIKNDYLLEEDEDPSIQQFIGFEIIDKNAGSLGIIKQVDESTQNTLFIIEYNREELLIPATDYYITDIDEINQIIYMDLPDGLVDMDLAEEE